MRRRRVEVVIEFFHILAVVAFRPGEAKKPLLQNRIFSVPKRQRETETALPIGDTKQPVFAPAIRAASCMIVREIIPAISVRRVILANGRPLPFRQIWPPAFPVLGTRCVFLQSLMFSRRGRNHVDWSLRRPIPYAATVAGGGDPGCFSAATA